MKKILISLADGILSKIQMKGIKGGYEAAGCTNDCGLLPSVSCSGTSCYTFEDLGGGCQSDTETKFCIPT